MWKLLKKVIYDALTEDNGSSYCWAKLASTFALTTYIAFAGWSMYHSNDGTLVSLFQSFGTNLAIILGGCGALIAAKQATQKAQPPPLPDPVPNPPAE